MALRGNDPESYITEHTLVYEDDTLLPLLTLPSRSPTSSLLFLYYSQA